MPLWIFWGTDFQERQDEMVMACLSAALVTLSKRLYNSSGTDGE